jgi:hypothetical protein
MFGGRTSGLVRGGTAKGSERSRQARMVTSFQSDTMAIPAYPSSSLYRLAAARGRARRRHAFVPFQLGRPYSGLATINTAITFGLLAEAVSRLTPVDEQDAPVMNFATVAGGSIFDQQSGSTLRRRRHIEGGSGHIEPATGLPCCQLRSYLQHRMLESHPQLFLCIGMHSSLLTVPCITAQSVREEGMKLHRRVILATT